MLQSGILASVEGMFGPLKVFNLFQVRHPRCVLYDQYLQASLRSGLYVQTTPKTSLKMALYTS